MPEGSQIWAKWEEARKGMRVLNMEVRRTTSLEEIRRTCDPTLLKSVTPIVDRELKSGERPIKLMHDMPQLEALGLLPWSKVKKEYIVHSFHRHGGIHELLLLDEDEAGMIRIIALRWVYLLEGTSGYADEADEHLFPLAPFDTDMPGMTFGRCRRSATARFDNLAPGYETKNYELLDGIGAIGFARMKVHFHVLLEDEVLGSDAWSERTYGIGPDYYRHCEEWALEYAKSLTGAGRHFEGAAISKGLVDQGSLMFIEALESEQWLLSAFGSFTKSEYVEILQLLG